MTQAVKRACDACHRRKVKCDGINPCRNCSSAQLSCTYNAITQKKGPKSSRAKVISELRETQRQTSLSAKVQNRMNGIASPPTNPTLGPTPGLLTSELVKECAHFFFDHLYPQAPILDRHQVHQQVLYMEHNRDAYCLMTSLCAFIMLQPGMSMPPGDPYNLDMVPGANIISCHLLLEETLRVRKGYDYLDSISINALVTNFFLFGCYYGQDMHDRAWYCLREATTMIHLAGMNKEEYYMQLDAAESACRRRIYWLFFVLERAYALQRQRPISLQATINPPTLGDDPADAQAHQLDSFIILVGLYRPFDDAFLHIWGKTKSHLSSQYLNNLQKQLSDIVQSFACQDTNFNDLPTNQQWLKHMAWQLSNSISHNAEDSISFQYPAHLARELVVKLVVNMASQFPVHIDLLGPGLIEKLLDMTSSMTEFLSRQAPSRDPFSTGPREHLNQIVSMVAMSRNGDHRFLPLLLHKVNEVLPRIANPILQDVPENAHMASVDIFDGFGNARMAQPPSHMPLPIGPDFDRKFPVEEFDKKYVLDMNSSTPESTTNSTHSGSPASMSQHMSSDMNGSFAGSPGMSPGVDYAHGVNSFGCPPIPELIIHPMGSHAQSNSIQAAHEQHHPHQYQRMSSSSHESSTPHYGNGFSPHSIRSQGIGVSGLASAHPMRYRPPALKQESFQMQGAPSVQALGDFNMHRPSPDATGSIVGISGIGSDMDFNSIR